MMVVVVVDVASVVRRGRMVMLAVMVDLVGTGGVGMGGDYYEKIFLSRGARVFQVLAGMTLCHPTTMETLATLDTRDERDR
jgi:dihydroorotate dehydrogenase